LNQSLEKLIIIGLNLTILVSVGLPLLLSTTQIISEAEQQLIYQRFIDEVDETIIFAEQNWISLNQTINVPANISIEAQNQRLVFKFFYNEWHITSRSYQVRIILTGPTTDGPNLFKIITGDAQLYIFFETSHGVQN
jgi:hypothetical protein